MRSKYIDLVLVDHLPIVWRDSRLVTKKDENEKRDNKCAGNVPIATYHAYKSLYIKEKYVSKYAIKLCKKRIRDRSDKT